MKYNRLMRLTPIASNPLPTSNLFTCTYGEIFDIQSEVQDWFSGSGGDRAQYEVLYNELSHGGRRTGHNERIYSSFFSA